MNGETLEAQAQFKNSCSPNSSGEREKFLLAQFKLREREEAAVVALQLLLFLFKELEELYVMEAQQCETISPQPRVKATIRLGSETYAVSANKGSSLSEQLVSMKGESMSILKDFITKHNVPNDVPDEPEDISSEDDGETSEKVTVKSKKQRK